MVRLTRKSLILAKIESSYGVDPTPTAASNSIATLNSSIKETFEEVERNVQISSLTRKQSVGAKKFAEVTFTAELIGSGTAGTAPRLGTLLRACAMSETVTSSTSVEYLPASSSLDSITIYFYQDGVEHVVTGCVGTYKMTCTAGSPAMLEFTFTGVWSTPTDVTLPTPTFESTVDSVPLCKSAGLALNSTSLVVNEFTLDMANTVATRPSINAATAIAGFQITDRKPVATIDPEAELVNTYNFRQDVLSTPRDLHLNVNESAGNNCFIDIPKFNTIDIAGGDREGTYVETITGLCSDGGSQDDEVSLLFT